MNTIDKMKTRLIRSEIARRNASDAETVEMILETLTTVNDDGDIVGIASQGHRPLSAMLDELEQTNPNYFSKTAPTQNATLTGPNPFKRGSGYSVTAQMILWRDQPELAHRLAAEADFQPGAR